MRTVGGMSENAPSTTYLSRVIPTTTEQLVAVVESNTQRQRENPSAETWSVATTAGRLKLGRHTASPAPGGRSWPALRLPGRLRIGARWLATPVELELAPWSDAATELGLRYCGRAWPGPAYFSAANAVLDVLAVELHERARTDAVEAVAGFLRLVPTPCRERAYAP